VSVGRRELADARRWLSGGWRRSVAPRTTEVAGMLAARDRAAGTTARAALLRGDDAGADTRVPGAAPIAAPVAAPIRSAPASAPVAGPTPKLAASSPAPTQTRPSAAPPPDEGDTLARLREAKRRNRER
jgi:hypothetical protein